VSFTVTPFDRRKHRTERVARVLLLSMTVAMIVPLVLIVGYLIVGPGRSSRSTS